MTLTEKDRELLSLLSENARIPVASLARALGLSRTTVQARLERLEQTGVIEGYGLKLSSAYRNGLISAHLLITIAPKSIARVCAELAVIREVQTLHSVSGEFDLIAILSAASISDLDALIDRVGQLDGVERTQTAVILSTRIDR
ncbi:Lrp/AsnC family transcriptional regulator [Limoniibacter endophyticus]|uniref:Transcriptional regulator n=1 Tax=Limoniibacter endophyticus TaxID=1565040 RepID=A0A8J3DU55_9HYPH|nr:Lrp/AsnC family transcriptional regulator [Limoniibacter endophyticus]GHC76897.1 transcriptional regulator [Limoniibacter endophyticus]